MRPTRRWIVTCAPILVLACRDSVLGAPRDDLRARHKGLMDACNKQDVKALAGFLAPDYRYEEWTGHKIPREEYLKGLPQIFQLMPMAEPEKGELTEISIKRDTATAVEIRTSKLKGGGTHRGRAAQTWKKVGGVWKLALERELKD